MCFNWEYRSLQSAATKSASVLLQQTSARFQLLLNPRWSYPTLSPCPAGHNPARSTAKSLQVSLWNTRFPSPARGERGGDGEGYKREAQGQVLTCKIRFLPAHVTQQQEEDLAEQVPQFDSTPTLASHNIFIFQHSGQKLHPVSTAN